MSPLVRSVGLRRGTFSPPFDPPTPVALDSFTDADDTLLTDHTPDLGPGWTVSGDGEWTIQGNRLTADNDNSNAIMDLGVTDTNVQITEGTAPGNSYGLILRYVDQDNNWQLQHRPRQPDIVIVEVTGGTATVRATAPAPDSAGGRLAFKVEGNVFTGYIDGVQLVTYTSSQHNTATKHGIRIGTQNAAEPNMPFYDDFSAGDDIANSATGWQVGALPDYLHWDTFSDTNAKALNDHRPDAGSTYRSMEYITSAPGAPGGGTVDGGRLKLATNNSGHYVNVGKADVDISFDWVLDASAAIAQSNSIVLRYTSDGNEYLIACVKDTSLIRILKIQSDSVTVVQDTAFSFTAGETYNIRVVASGSTITVYVDDVEVVEVTSQTFNQTATRHGLLRNNGHDNTRMDNFLIKSASGGDAVDPGLTFQPHAGNPIFDSSVDSAIAGNFLYWSVIKASDHIGSPIDNYYAYYSTDHSGNDIYLATAPSPLGPWTEQGQLSGLTGETPLVIWDAANSRYNMYFHGGSPQQTSLATSTDGENWTVQGVAMPASAVSGSFTKHTGYANVWVESGTWHAYTLAADAGGVWAYWTSADGASWTLQSQALDPFAPARHHDMIGHTNGRWFDHDGKRWFITNDRSQVSGGGSADAVPVLLLKGDDYLSLRTPSVDAFMDGLPFQTDWGIHGAYVEAGSLYVYYRDGGSRLMVAVAELA